MLGSDIAANRATLRGVAVIGRCEGHHHDLSGKVGEHQPVCWRCRWVEQRIRVPDLVDVVDAERVMFEEVGSLPVELEWIGVVQLIEIEQVTHIWSVLQTNTKVESPYDLIEQVHTYSPRPIC